jgi:hypothetical protein
MVHIELTVLSVRKLPLQLHLQITIYEVIEGMNVRDLRNRNSRSFTGKRQMLVILFPSTLHSCVCVQVRPTILVAIGVTLRGVVCRNEIGCIARSCSLPRLFVRTKYVSTCSIKASCDMMF